MGNKKRNIAIAATAAAGLAGVLFLATRAKAAPPQEPPEEPEEGYANLYGRITNHNNGQVISGVFITLGELMTTTDGNGDYIFTDMEPGSYDIGMTRDGYEGVSLTVDLVEGNNELNFELVPTGGEEPPEEPEEGISINGISVSPTSLTDARHEYETSLGLGFWGDAFDIAMTYKNPLDTDIWLKPDYAFGHLNGETLQYIEDTLQGFDALSLLYFRLLLNTEYVQGDYSHNTDWQHPWDPRGANKLTNMVLGIYDPDNVPRTIGAADYWIKIPPKGSKSASKQAHLGTNMSVPFPDTFDLCIAASKAYYFVYDPGYGQQRVGNQWVTVNWRPIELDPVAVVVPNLMTITPI